jgi:hypothetical protein
MAGVELVIRNNYLHMKLHKALVYIILFSGVFMPGVVSAQRIADDLPRFSPTEPQLYNIYLIKVSDVKVETELGNLPRLPSYVPGTYSNKMKGPPKVRVLWPAATDNTAVLKPGPIPLRDVLQERIFNQRHLLQ